MKNRPVSYIRGNRIHYNGSEWVYDDGKPITKERPCIRCKKMPGEQGIPYDACLGYIEGVTAACCGHGIEEGYIIKQEEKNK